VLLVAFVLAFVAGMLRERQERNVALDTKTQILASLDIEANMENAEVLYKEYVKEVIKTENRLPVYICEKAGERFYVLALHGTGLYGPIWGYISLKEDKNTVFGAYFSHKSETPGLGAEIAKEEFQSQFHGKEIFKKGEFKSIAIVKPGKIVDEMDYVDGISGGTITSQCVHNMLLDGLGEYKEFLMEK